MQGEMLIGNQLLT